MNQINKTHVNSILFWMMATGYLTFVLCAFFGIKFYFAEKDSLKWPTVTGVISISEIKERIVKQDNKETKAWEPVINFNYEVDGQKYTGDKIGGSIIQSSNPTDAENLTNKFSKGKTVSVYYKPEDPTVALLIPGISGLTKFLLFISLVGLLEGIVFTIILIKMKKKKVAST